MAERKGPAASATSFIPGTRKKGNDGNYWIVKQDVNGRHRWAKETTPKNKVVRKKTATSNTGVKQARYGKYLSNGSYILGKKLGSALTDTKGIASQSKNDLSYYDYGTNFVDAKYKTLEGKSPAKYKGKRVLNEKDGKTYISDGTTWSEAKMMEETPTAYAYYQTPKEKLKYDVDEVVAGLVEVANTLKDLPLFVVFVGWKYVYNFVDNMGSVIAWAINADKRLPKRDPKIDPHFWALLYTSWVGTSEFKMLIAQETGVLDLQHNILQKDVRIVNEEMKKVFGTRYTYGGPKKTIQIKLKVRKE